MHQIIRAGQIKAARAILDWSQEDLAQKTGLALNTIRNLETGSISPREKTVSVIRQAVEKAGLEFIEPAGVRLRMEEINVHHGPESHEMLLEDMLQTTQKTDGEIAVIIKTQEMLAQSFGVTNRADLNRLDRLNAVASVKCLLLDTSAPPFPMPRVQFRAIRMDYSTPTPYFVYGNKHALVLSEGRAQFRFIVFTWPSLAHSYRSHFHALWDKAEPLVSTANG